MFAAVAWPPARDTDQVAGGVVAEQNSARREVTALEGPSVCKSASPPSAALPVVLRRPGRPEIAVRQSLSFRRDDQASPPLKLSFFRLFYPLMGPPLPPLPPSASVSNPYLQSPP